MVDVTWSETTTAALIDQGALEIGDGYRAKNSEFADSGLPFLRIGNMSGDGLDLEGADLFPEEDLAKVAGKVSRPGDSVIATKATIGRLAYIEEHTPQVVYSPQVSYWRVLDPGVLEPRFLRYWLQGREFTGQAQQTKGSTSMADYINLRDQRRMSITLPPVSVQRKIGMFLSAYSDLIENNLRRIEILEEMAQAIYREWFVDYRYPGWEDEGSVDSALGPIPRTWTVSSVAQAIALNPRTKMDGTVERLFVPMGSLVENSMVILDTERRKGTGGAQFMNGDVLLARITPSLENGKTAFVQCLSEGEIGRGSTEFIVMRGKSVPSEWVYLFARTDEFRNTAIKSMVGASGRQRVQEAALEGFQFAHPDTPTLARFSDTIRPFFELVQTLVEMNKCLRTCRDALLPGLVSGEIDVSDVDIDTSWLAA